MNITLPITHIKDTIDLIVEVYRRQSTSCLTERLLSNDCYDSCAKLSGLHLLFSGKDNGYLTNMIDDATNELKRLRANGEDRLRTQQLALEVERDAFPEQTSRGSATDQQRAPIRTSDLGRSPASSPVELGQESNQGENKADNHKNNAENNENKVSNNENKVSSLSLNDYYGLGQTFSDC